MSSKPKRTESSIQSSQNHDNNGSRSFFMKRVTLDPDSRERSSYSMGSLLPLPNQPSVVLPIMGLDIQTIENITEVFISLPYMKSSLQNRMNNYVGNAHAIIDCFKKLLTTIDVIHNHNDMYHGNIKPSNIFFDVHENIVLSEMEFKKESFQQNSGPVSLEDYRKRDIFRILVVMAELCRVDFRSRGKCGFHELIHMYQNIEENKDLKAIMVLLQEEALKLGSDCEVAEMRRRLKARVSQLQKEIGQEMPSSIHHRPEQMSMSISTERLLKQSFLNDEETQKLKELTQVDDETFFEEELLKSQAKPKAKTAEENTQNGKKPRKKKHGKSSKIGCFLRFVVMPLIFTILFSLLGDNYDLIPKIFENESENSDYHMQIINTGFAELKRQMEDQHKSLVHLAWNNGPSISVLQKWSWSSLSRSITDSKLDNITKSLKAGLVKSNLTELKSFEVQIENASKMTDKGLLSLLEDLTVLKKVESLTFYFNSTKDLTDQGMRSFIKTIGEKFPRVKYLTLGLSQSKYMTNSGLKALGSQLGDSLFGLQNFSLSLEKCDKIQDEGVQVFLAESIPNFVSLKNLHLNFEKTPISEKGIKEIVVLIQNNLKRLQSLSLQLQGSKVSLNATKALQNSFSKIPSVSIT